MKEKLRKIGIIICIILAGVIIGFYLIFNEDGISKYISVTAPGDVFGTTVVIDAGHGGEDGGAVGFGGIVEKDINLSIALKLKEILEVWGYNVVMTREEDISIYDESAVTIREKKVSDLHNRLKIAHSTPNAIFVSIHQNMFSQSNCDGAQVFYGVKNGESQRFARILQNNFKDLLQPDNKRQEKKSGDNIYLLWNLEIPAIMVECGFISNEAEAKLLTDEEYQSKAAFVIFCSISEFINGDVETEEEISGY